MMKLNGWVALLVSVPRDHSTPSSIWMTRMTPLTDATFIANTLSSFSPQTKQAGAGTGWRGIGRKVEVAVLQEADSGDRLPAALQSLTLDE